MRLKSALPGYGLTLTLTLFWVGAIVLVPLSAVFIRSAGDGWGHFIEAGFSDRAVAAYRVGFGAAAAATAINAVFGLLIAWVLVRVDFPGRKFISALVDLPFALPTAVAGIALTTLYADTGWIGGVLAPLGLPVAYHPQGIVVALTFIGLPFVVRAVEPVLMDLEPAQEEAAASLGAERWTIFRNVIFPEIAPALATGCSMAFARGVGEYGSVIFIAGNMPMVSEIPPLLIVTQLEQYDYSGASAIAVVMLLFSFAVLAGVNLLQAQTNRRIAA